MKTWDLDLSQSPELHGMGTSREGSRRDAQSAQTWRIHFYKNAATLVVGDEQLDIVAGCVGITPPGLRHEYLGQGRAEYLYAHFTLPASTGETVRIAALQDLGIDFKTLSERFERAIQVFGARPRQAEARVWDLLWELSDRPTAGDSHPVRRHAALETACQAMQTRFAEPLSVRGIASLVGVSPAHLTRLFRARLGVTAMEYLRRWRLETAFRLLTRTEVPIKEVACEVGVPNLHAFNKFVRRGYRASPRELRARSRAQGGRLQHASSNP